MTTTTGSSTDPSASIALGSMLALCSAMTYGGITTFARIAYDAGSTPLTVITTRFFLASTMFALVCVLFGLPLTVPRKYWGAIARTALAWFVGAVGYLSSVHFIPVGLAALTFFTFPMLVAVLMALSERRGLSAREFLPLLAAFAGLALALGPSLENLSLVGVGLALMGACGSAGQFFCSRNVVRDNDVRTVLVFVNFGGGMLALTLLLATGAWSLPAGTEAATLAWGWTGFTFATCAYVLAVFLMYGSIRNAGPARSAMLFNLEPLISIGAAALLLGERLSPVQLVGAALVIGALVAATTRRRPAPAVP